MQDTPTRRRFLTLVGSTAIVGLAGCTGGSAGDDGTPTATPTKTHHEEESHHHTENASSHHHEESTQTPTNGHAHHQHHDGHHHEKIPHEPADHVDVKMLTTEDGSYHFTPHLAWVKPGGTVTWVNASGSHTSTAYAPKYDKPRRIPTQADPWDSGLFTEQGKTFEHTFEVEGVYDYYCKPHEQFGMVGTVLVGHPDLHDQAGMQPPQDSLPSKTQQKLNDLNKMVEEVLGHHEG